MKKVISETLDYPNMLPDEIIKMGIPLSEDALARFKAVCLEEVSDELESLREELTDAHEEELENLEREKGQIGKELNEALDKIEWYEKNAG